ncbi:MAG: DNA primase [Gemmatimonadales bacterium]
MARIPDEVIERVRDTADLLEIVQESVQLKRQGSDYRGPCPFHNGTGRNFAVIPKKNLYYCFVCHAAGDVFTWYRERFGMDYPTAVREVARRYGIAIPEATERAGPDPREPFYQAADAAQGWFAAQLRDNPEAEGARRYLLERQFSLDAAAELGLGYAPRGNELIAAMKQLGITDEAMLEAALVMRRDDGTFYSRFRGRLIFPIHDLRGRTVAFGGRILGTGEPKYLNSPETPIFHKGEQLYHIHLAKHAIRKAGFAIVVEGYFDVLRLALAGIDYVVAPLGTALTEAQATLLKRYSEEVILLYDSDGPGLKATFRAGDVLISHGVRVRVATMPSGDDPDTVVQRGGAAALEPILHDAVDLLERKLHLLELKGWFGDVRRSREALDRLLPTLRAAADPVTRELYISRVAERLGIPRDVVATDVASKPHYDAPRPTSEAPSVPSRPTTRPVGDRGPKPPGAEIERKLLRLLLLRPEWLARAREEIPTDRFTVAAFRRIYGALAALPDDAPIGDALPALDERARDAWERLTAAGGAPEGYDVDREYVGALEALEEIHQFPDIASEADPLERRRRWQALSKEGQARFRLYLATNQRSRSDPGAMPPEE